MSVRTDQRKESSQDIFNTAHELELLTIRLSVRENAIPKRYRYILGQKLCDAAREMNKNIVSANSIFPKKGSEYELRRGYQFRALAALKDLLELMRIATELLPIKNTVVEEWSTMAYKEEKALRSWMQSDKQRYKDLP